MKCHPFRTATHHIRPHRWRQTVQIVDTSRRDVGRCNKTGAGGRPSLPPALPLKRCSAGRSRLPTVPHAFCSQAVYTPNLGRRTRKARPRASVPFMLWLSLCLPTGTWLPEPSGFPSRPIQLSPHLFHQTFEPPRQRPPAQQLPALIPLGTRPFMACPEGLWVPTVSNAVPFEPHRKTSPGVPSFD